jgi:uncharacterized protein YyaL (SSP411 family)
MRSRQLAKLTTSFLRRPRYTLEAVRAGRAAGRPDLRDSVRKAADWLMLAQRSAPDGDGYSRRYRLLSGWDRCYIETTGYIAPTMFDAGRRLQDDRYADSARTAGEWLLSVQRADGAFTDVDRYQPHVFDTGQVLIGLNSLYRETHDDRFLRAAERAATWLSSVQEEDGSWLRYTYNQRRHSYYSRVAAALIDTGELVARREYSEAGRRNLAWVLQQRLDNGYFRHSEFREGEDAFLHTIVYVLEGFSIAFNLTREDRWMDAMLRGAVTLRGLLNEEGLLYSQYDPGWRPTNKEYCVTGLAQFAGICLDAAEATGDTEFKNVAEGIIGKVSSWQLCAGADLVGAFPASVPVWGAYGSMELVNWTVKFYIDAALRLLPFR